MFNRKKIQIYKNWIILIESVLLAVITIILIAVCTKTKASTIGNDVDEMVPETQVALIEDNNADEAAFTSETDEFDIYDYIGEDGIYQASEYIELLKYLSTCPTVYYSGDDWSSWNGTAWQFDCLCLPKSILYWGWSGDKTAANGGATYSRRKDYTEDRMIDRCENVSDDFSVLTPGELLYTEGHVGTYIGDGLVIECTDAFGDGGVLVTQIDANGTRSYNGEISEHSWELHGFVTVIDYDTEAETLN